MVKASEGGGGKGIRKVHKQEDLEAAYRQAIGLTVIFEMFVFFNKSFLSSVVFRCLIFALANSKFILQQHCYRFICTFILTTLSVFFTSFKNDKTRDLTQKAEMS